MWGTQKTFIFWHFPNFQNSEASQRKTQEMYICFRFSEKQTICSPAESPLLKPLIMRINVILVTVVPLKLIKMLLEDLKDSFP